MLRSKRPRSGRHGYGTLRSVAASPPRRVIAPVEAAPETRRRFPAFRQANLISCRGTQLTEGATHARQGTHPAAAQPAERPRGDAWRNCVTFPRGASSSVTLDVEARRARGGTVKAMPLAVLACGVRLAFHASGCGSHHSRGCDVNDGDSGGLMRRTLVGLLVAAGTAVPVLAALTPDGAALVLFAVIAAVAAGLAACLGLPAQALVPAEHAGSPGHIKKTSPRS